MFYTDEQLSIILTSTSALGLEGIDNDAVDSNFAFLDKIVGSFYPALSSNPDKLLARLEKEGLV